MLGKKTKQNRFLSKVLMWILCVCVLMIKSILKLKSYSQVVKTKNAKKVHIYIHTYIYIYENGITLKKKTHKPTISAIASVYLGIPPTYTLVGPLVEREKWTRKDHSWLGQQEEIPQLPWELYPAKAVCLFLNPRAPGCCQHLSENTESFQGGPPVAMRSQEKEKVVLFPCCLHILE